MPLESLVLLELPLLESPVLLELPLLESLVLLELPLLVSQMRLVLLVSQVRPPLRRGLLLRQWLSASFCRTEGVGVSPWRF